jgi:hypothetical protein
MSPKQAFLALFLSMFLPALSGAGELVKRTYVNAEGKKVTGYVYQSGKSQRGSASRSNVTRSYPAYRSTGYTSGYSYGRGGYSARHYHNSGCRPSRSAVQTTRTNITYNVARPITLGSPRGGIRVYRRR